MSRSMRLSVCLLAFVFICSGCVAPWTLGRLPMREFLVGADPAIHLALRGQRRGTELRNQVFLLTAAQTLWIWGAALTLPDGTRLAATEISSLEKRDDDGGVPIALGFGVGVAGGLRGRRGGWGEHGSEGWGEGTAHGGRSSAVRSGIGMGVGVPLWRAFGRSGAGETPRSVEFRYDLPEGLSTCDGAEFTVYVATADDQDGDSGDGADEASTPADADSTESVQVTELRIPVTFVLGEILSGDDDSDDQDGDEATDDTREQTREMLRDVQFTLKQRT